MTELDDILNHIYARQQKKLGQPVLSGWFRREIKEYKYRFKSSHFDKEKYNVICCFCGEIMYYQDSSSTHSFDKPHPLREKHGRTHTNLLPFV